MVKKTQKLFGLSIVLLFIVMAISYPGAADTQYGMIDGNTYYSSGWGMYPLPFTTVTAGGGHTDVSNVLGEYAIDDLPLGTYSITASKWGYESVTFIIELTESSPFAHVDFILEKNSGDGSSYKSVKSVEFVELIEESSTIHYQVYLQPTT